MANQAIKRARDAIGINQDELADDVGLSTSQISRFENGERDPRATEIVAMARRLKVTIDELMEAYLEPGDEELIPANTELVKRFRQASPEIQQAVKKILPDTNG
jgi:transcriptional regulator with XRE-family HTH domain